MVLDCFGGLFVFIIEVEVLWGVLYGCSGLGVWNLLLVRCYKFF